MSALSVIIVMNGMQSNGQESLLQVHKLLSVVFKLAILANFLDTLSSSKPSYMLKITLLITQQLIEGLQALVSVLIPLCRDLEWMEAQSLWLTSLMIQTIVRSLIFYIILEVQIHKTLKIPSTQ